MLKLSHILPLFFNDICRGSVNNRSVGELGPLALQLLFYVFFQILSESQFSSNINDIAQINSDLHTVNSHRGWNLWLLETGPQTFTVGFG